MNTNRITYQGIECVVLTTDLTNKGIIIENMSGRNPWLQKLITNQEFKRILNNKPEPKYDPNKKSRLMYNGKAETNWIDLKQVFIIKAHLLRKSEYSSAKFIIEQQ